MKSNEILQLLESNKNLILHGPPGTGKTYLAKKIASALIFNTLDISDESIEKNLKDNEQFGFVQFHPSYDYTDFVEGLRPIKNADNQTIGFELKNGIFKDFCEKARDNNNTGKKFVFVIDEINRGEISRIFGELFFSIDPGYRGKKGAIKTQYANLHASPNELFYVPENVYIIGTMNDIDRSVESFDFAMRRRFVWVEITADESAKQMNLSQDAVNKLARLNGAIERIEGLNASYHIGAAYFLSNGNPVTDFENLWKLRLEPLFKEYLRGMQDAQDKLQKLKDAFWG